MANSARRRPPIDDFISRCQEFAERIIDIQSGDLGGNLRVLVSDLPPDLSIRERLLVRHLVNRIVGRVAMSAGTDNRKDIAAALLRWESSDTAARSSGASQGSGSNMDSSGGSARPARHSSDPWVQAEDV
jgi:hypothetical protein